MEGNASVYQVNPVSRITAEGWAEILSTWGPDFNQKGGGKRARGGGTGGAARFVRGNYKSFLWGRGWGKCSGGGETEASTPNMLCPHTASTINHQLWLRQVLSAPGAEIPSRNKCLEIFKILIKPRISNAEFMIPPDHNMIKKTLPILLYEFPILICLHPQRLELFLQHDLHAIKHERHRLPGALRLRRPFPGDLDDNLVVTTERQSGHDPAALHRRRLQLRPHHPCP